MDGLTKFCQGFGQMRRMNTNAWLYRRAEEGEEIKVLPLCPPLQHTKQRPPSSKIKEERLQAIRSGLHGKEKQLFYRDTSSGVSILFSVFDFWRPLCDKRRHKYLPTPKK